MTHSAKVLAHSVSPDGVKLASLEVVMPRIVLAEFNTHRMFSRNSASSRAIPIEKMIKMVQENPYVPSVWPKNQKGMSASENLENTPGYWPADEAQELWLLQRDEAVRSALGLQRIGVHKQITNRLLEPFLWHTVIVTATEWQNFFHLRDNPQAHPDIQKVARLMREALEASTPRELKYGEWHLPLIRSEDYDEIVSFSWETMVKVSVGRCARVSYLSHDGKRDPQADIELHDRLLASGHLSPFEHVARPATKEDTEIACVNVNNVVEEGRGIANRVPSLFASPRNQWSGNFRGWVQYRKLIPHEADILGAQR